MRNIAFALGLLGACAGLGLGALFVLGMGTQSSVDQRTMQMINSPLLPEHFRTGMVQTLARLKALPYALLAGGLLSLLGALSIRRGHKLAAFILFTVAAAGPLALFVGATLAAPRLEPLRIEDINVVLLSMLGFPAALLLFASLLGLLSARPQNV